MSKLSHYLLLFLVLTLVGCSTGKKSFKKGDYETAIEKAVKRLRSNPYNEKAKTALIDGYFLYYRDLEQEIADLKRTDKVFKWEDISSKYGQLNRAYELIQSCPACKELVGYAENYPKEQEEARQKAAVERYEAGQLSLKENTRLSAKRAYFHFKKTKEYDPNYEGIDKVMSEAKELATIRVLVQNTSKRKDQGYFFDRVYEEILNASKNEFVAFYEANVSEPHHKLEISIDHFKINEPEIVKEKSKLQSDSLVVGRILQDSVYQDVMGVVYADLITFTKNVSAEGRGSIKIVDLSTGETLSIKSFPDTQGWDSSWATFNGDKRALTEEQYELTNESEPSPPNSQFFYDKVSRGVGGKLAKHIRGFYAKY